MLSTVSKVILILALSLAFATA